MRCYISGPMTGYEGYNYAAFNRAADILAMAGWTPINPAANFGGVTNHPDGRPAYMRLDFTHVLDADAVFVLPGWDQSRGARVEVLMAQELGLPIYHFLPALIQAGAQLEVQEKVDTHVR